MSQNVKMIPCRQCGKMYKPCAFCQEHNDVWRWRNFCCSLKCATEYIKTAQSYRDAQEWKAKQTVVKPPSDSIAEKERQNIEKSVAKTVTPTTPKQKPVKNTAKTTSTEVTNDKETTK